MKMLLLVLLSWTLPAYAQNEKLVGAPCEGCEAVFQFRPSNIGPIARIDLAGEPGEKLELTGVVRGPDGKPVPGIIVYAYQTNAAGIYPSDERLQGQAAHRHGKLRGFARTDAGGNYRFDTVRPGGYPGTDIPQHIHMHIVEPGRCTYYIDDVVFEDDARLTATKRRSMTEGRGGPGLVKPRRDGATWRIERDIELGKGIRDYAACGK